MLFRNSISRVSVLPEWDSVFDAWRTGHVQAYDPSLIQIFIPDYIFAAKQIGKGILPLWNSYNGFGYPFLADIQTSVFAPMRAIFDIYPTLYTYNLYLLIELLVCAISMYFLARVLGQSRLASIFATTCYTFCPYNLWYLELNLGTAHSLFPLTALTFANAAVKRTLGSALLAGLASCVLIISGHPECAFFGIILSSILMFLMIFSDSSNVSSMFEKTKAAFGQLFGAGITAFFLSAPVLIPFVEYLMNAESYKYGSAYSTPVTWNAIFYNLANPAIEGAAPYIGIVASIFLFYGIYTIAVRRHKDAGAVSILWLALITFLVVAQIGPVQALFSQPPLTAIITRYALPYLLMLMALISSKGFESLQDFLNSTGIYRRGSSQAQTVSKLLQGAVEIVCFLILPAVLLFVLAKLASQNAAFMHLCDFDAMLPPSSFHQSAWRRDLAIACISGGLILGLIVCRIRNANKQIESSRLFGNLGKTLYLGVPFALLFLQLISQGGVARFSLPSQTKFYYPNLEITEHISDPLYRTISLREHVFRPATNVIYDLHFAQMHNPLFPRRFLEFMRAAGASTDTFNQKFSSVSSPLLSMASVKYVLSIDPISEPGFKQTYMMPNQIKVYENENALPRAYIVTSPFEISHGGGPTSLKRIKDSDFNPRTEVVLEDPRTPSREPPTAEEARKNIARIFDFQDTGSNSITMKCASNLHSWLVLTDIYYPGWKAFVDEKEVEIVRANFAFRAIEIPPGEHAVRFVYQPKSFELGLMLFASFLLVTILAFSIRLRRKA